MSIYKWLFQKPPVIDELPTASLSYLCKKFLHWIYDRKIAIGEAERHQREEAERKQTIKRNRFATLSTDLINYYIEPFVCKVLEMQTRKSFSTAQYDSELIAHLEWNISEKKKVLTGSRGEELDMLIPTPEWLEEFMTLYSYFHRESEGCHSNVDIAKDFIKSLAKSTEYRVIAQVYCIFSQDESTTVIRNESASLTVNIFVCYDDKKRRKSFKDIQSEFA